jgi:AraC family transcriptional regulator
LNPFVFFFAEGFVDEVRRSMNSGMLQLLDTPIKSSQTPVNFFERTYRHDYVISPAMAALRRALKQGERDVGWLNEQLQVIARQLLLAHQLARREVENLDSVRLSTREELYRRLHRARDFIAACYRQKITLEQVARVACLSPNHLLRTFKQLFHQTPHQYLTARRLEQARKLLRQTDIPVTEICLAVGFVSLGSFSTLFRQHTGCSPDTYRHRAKK